MKRALILMMLAACAQAEMPDPLPENDTCNAAPRAALIGQDATALERVLIMGKVRVLRPGQAMTILLAGPDQLHDRRRQQDRADHLRLTVLGDQAKVPDVTNWVGAIDRNTGG